MAPPLGGLHLSVLPTGGEEGLLLRAGGIFCGPSDTVRTCLFVRPGVVQGTLYFSGRRDVETCVRALSRLDTKGASESVTTKRRGEYTLAS
eukprot:8010482-Pyramimonas_sp.AAC.1